MYMFNNMKIIITSVYWFLQAFIESICVSAFSFNRLLILTHVSRIYRYVYTFIRGITTSYFYLLALHMYLQCLFKDDITFTILRGTQRNIFISLESHYLCNQRTITYLDCFLIISPQLQHFWCSKTNSLFNQYHFCPNENIHQV